MENKLQTMPEESNETDKKVNSKRNEYIISAIISLIIGIILIKESIQEHWSVIGTIWCFVLFIFTTFLMIKYELDNSWFLGKIVYGVIYFTLLGISFFIYTALKHLGFDLLMWRF